MGRTINYPDGEKGYVFSGSPGYKDASCEHTGLVITTRDERFVIISQRDRYGYQVAPVLADGTLGKLRAVSIGDVTHLIAQAEPYACARTWEARH